ncbi:MAG: DUF1549 domain-containing protein, partial [Planctomycetaceae bacterium]|nr:DUF1549 domain-containing protein [Planctomycetaceae bacterium]
MAKTDLFRKRVLPILAENCSECHQTELTEAGLNLGSQEMLLRGSKSGAVLVPGNASQSLLIQVLAKEAKPHMPPEGQLSVEEVTRISEWIQSLDKNTKVGTARRVEGTSDHWAFRPLNRPNVPEVKNTTWALTPVDRFVLAGLEREGLSPSPPANRDTLLRRVYFDLIGLPP